MTSRDFCFWLQGYFEISNHTVLTDSQTECIKRHLALVFKHDIDPSMGKSYHQISLNDIHSGGSGSGITTGINDTKFRC